MGFIRKFIRNRIRPARRRAVVPTMDDTPRDYTLATVAVGPLADILGEDACTCPVCQYLDTIDAPRDVLPDGTVVHRLTEEEHRVISALMSRMPIDV